MVAAWVRRLVPVPLVVLLVAGCYSFAEPSFHPGDPRDVLVEMTRRGVEVESSVAGASACADPGLVGNVIHLVVTVPSDRTPRDLYLYTFRSRSWEGSQPAVDACEAEYAAANPGARVARVDVPTYRTLGLDWSDELTTIVRDALEEASTQGT